MRSLLLCLTLTFAAISIARADNPKPADVKRTGPGPTADGFMLPNGWHLTPVGTHIETTDLPLNIVPLKDNRRALVATSGFNQHHLYVVDLPSAKVVSKETARQSWFGLALDQKEEQIWWAGGGSAKLHSFSMSSEGELKKTSPADAELGKLDAAALEKLRDELTGTAKGFKSGLCYNNENGVLYSLDINSGAITFQPTITRQAAFTKLIGGRPYDVCLGPKGNLLYVSDWAGRQVLALDPTDLHITSKISVGEHPNQLVLHPTDGRLFVPCASSNTVHVIDTKLGVVTEIIGTALFPRAPEGSTPCAAAISPDGKTLYVANADNNAVAVIDISTPNQSTVTGFIPTGWYPTAVAVTPDGKNILIGVGKGLQSKANPKFTPEQIKAKETDEVKAVARKLLPYPYIGTTLSGALSIVPVPNEATLKEYTAKVYRNCPYSDSVLTAALTDKPNPVPSQVGQASPIKYVVYIIKENRTYDQVFGDMAEGPNAKGNGDPSLCMFPRKVTPNHHKLAEEFVLLDNLYCNGQVSRDGHPWSTMAYHTDYIARDWHLTYSQRKGVDDDDEGHLANAPSGYLWDACKRAGVSYRNYGEYGKRVSDGLGGTKMEGRVPGLVGHMCPNYPAAKKGGGRVRDTENAAIFLAEYDAFAKAGTMPKFIVMSLGEDHTDGTRVGSFTPQACVASNDLALGQIVDAISNGPLWKETAIFVIEDDAQNGPDHVDAHRTVGLVISPYTKRKVVDSTQYSTVSMIRTMELILGLQPLSQYDAAARPMYESFTMTADAAPYQHLPAEFDLQQKNTALSYGAERSEKMDFSEYDKIDDFELNEILWRSIKGKDAPLPPAVRRAIAFRALPVEKK